MQLFEALVGTVYGGAVQTRLCTAPPYTVPTVYHRTLPTLTLPPRYWAAGAVSVGGVDTDPGSCSCCWKIAVNYLSLATFNADLSIKVFSLVKRNILL